MPLKSPLSPPPLQCRHGLSFEDGVTLAWGFSFLTLCGRPQVALATLQSISQHEVMLDPPTFGSKLGFCIIIQLNLVQLGGCLFWRFLGRLHGRQLIPPTPSARLLFLFRLLI